MHQRPARVNTPGSRVRLGTSKGANTNLYNHMRRSSAPGAGQEQLGIKAMA